MRTTLLFLRRCFFFFGLEYVLAIIHNLADDWLCIWCNFNKIQFGIIFRSHGVAYRYLGQQGDIWDGQKDMALATLGAVLSAMVICAVRWNPQGVAVCEEGPSAPNADAGR